MWLTAISPHRNASLSSQNKYAFLRIHLSTGTHILYDYHTRLSFFIQFYIIKGERGSGCICLNGAAARKVQVGDTVIIIAYALMDFEEAKTFKPTVVFPKEGNKV